MREASQPPRSPDEPTETHAAGKGMPERTRKPGPDRLGTSPALQDDPNDASLELPHERDQSSRMTDDKPRPEIRQAGIDESSGRKDTSKGVEMNDTYQKQK